MVTRDDINSFLIQIKGYIDSSNANLKKELIEYINSKNQELKNYTDNRSKNTENNVGEKIEQRLEANKTETIKQITAMVNKILADISTSYIILMAVQNDLKDMKKELIDLKKKNMDTDVKLKNIKSIL